MARKDNIYLTKSRFLAGLTCPKKLWLGCHQPLPYEEPPTGSPMAMGAEIGIKAHNVFPGGILVDSEPWEHNKAVQQTEQKMADKFVPAIFEGAFEYADIRIRVDVLERCSGERWKIHEVKGSASVKIGSHLPAQCVTNFSFLALSVRQYLYVLSDDVIK